VTREFSAPTRVISGRGCVQARLADEVAALGAEVAVVIADRGVAEAGVLDTVLAAVEGTRLPVCALIGEDPDVAEVERAYLAATDAGAEVVLAIGGGSALCAGKAVAMRMRNPALLWDYCGCGRLEAPPAPVIAVPTTAGSGSEVSNVVVLHDPGHALQLVIFGHGYAPVAALLDGELLRTLPRGPMIAAALDALTHAHEALWVHRASPITDALALSAARHLRIALPAALDGDVDAMQRLLEASAMANLACGNSGLGLVHAITSSPDVHVPHGRQNGVLLPHVAAFNAPVVSDEAAAEIGHLDDLYERIGFPASFAAEEVGPAEVEHMVVAGMRNAFRQNNRRLAEEGDIRRLLAQAGAPVRQPA
jgi:alcohol dehydrogenase